ncbi:MAG: hypothetical protein J6S14_14035 [Clostridia bacterium]|nr:hypothetical protein [Clostridia bacterium]
MDECDRNFEHCTFYTDHKSGVLLGDGLCVVVRKKPKPVRKWFKGCKEFTRKEDL